MNEAYKQYPVMKAMQSDLLPQLVIQAQKGGAADVPKEKLQKYMAQSWAADGLTLSQRTTKGAKAVVTDCTKVIKTSLENGDGVYNMAKKLFDGYKAGSVIPEQDIPKFLEKLTDLTQDYQSASFKRALRAAQRNINKLSTQGMKAAYNGVLDAIEKGNEDKLNKAIHIATQERTRYFAQRIARTEMARAYADGVFYRWYKDADCVAFKWELSSRHPCDDICDLYAHADLWGMGEGIFPKDKVPTLPVHPNCMCRLVPVFAGSPQLKSEKPKDRSLDGGMEYIERLSKSLQISLLGKTGAEKVDSGDDWRKHANGVSNKVMQSRIEPDVITVCNINPDIYSGITSDIRGEEVIITSKQVKHIKERHSDAAELVLEKYKTTLEAPDYIFLDEKHEHTGLVVKRIAGTDKDEIINVVLRIAISSDADEIKHSIITGWKISESRLRNYIRRKKNVYTKAP